MTTFQFELVSPERILLAADAELVVLPAAEGEMGVMAGHAPVVTSLTAGMIRARLTGGTKDVFIRGGFAEVTAEKMTVLVERAFIVEEADQRMVERELEATEKALAEEKDDEARRHLDRAIGALRALRRAA